MKPSWQAGAWRANSLGGWFPERRLQKPPAQPSSDAVPPTAPHGVEGSPGVAQHLVPAGQALLPAVLQADDAVLGVPASPRRGDGRPRWQTGGLHVASGPTAAETT